jgi:hypothetical protein
MTPAQCKAARSQMELSHNAGISRSTVTAFELASRPVPDDRVMKMQLALEDAGIEVTNGKKPGVKMR